MLEIRWPFRTLAWGQAIVVRLREVQNAGVQPPNIYPEQVNIGFRERDYSLSCLLPIPLASAFEELGICTNDGLVYNVFNFEFADEYGHRVEVVVSVQVRQHNLIIML